MSKDEITPDSFDIESCLDDAHLPETTVRVNKYAHLVARLADLEEQHTAALKASAGDVRLSSKRTAAHPIAEEIERVRAEMESGWLTIRLRGLTADEMDRVNKPKDSRTKTLRALSIQAVEPTLTEAQAEALRDKIGVGQFTALITAANNIAFGEVATPDFSAAVLATLATPDSATS